MILVRKKRFFGRHGMSLLEYMAVLMFIIGIFAVFQDYIKRGFLGRWKTVGDSFGHGRQYDPKPYGVAGAGGGTLECMYMPADLACPAGCPAPTHSWISVRDFDACVGALQGDKTKECCCRITTALNDCQNVPLPFTPGP